jgi:hypothetical protein
MQIHDASHISERTLILPSLQKKVYDFFQTRKDLIFETSIQSGLFHVLLLPLILSDNEQTDRKTLVVIPAPEEAEEFRKQNSGIASASPERIIDGLRRERAAFRK